MPSRNTWKDTDGGEQDCFLQKGFWEDNEREPELERKLPNRGGITGRDRGSSRVRRSDTHISKIIDFNL